MSQNIANHRRFAPALVALALLATSPAVARTPAHSTNSNTAAAAAAPRPAWSAALQSVLPDSWRLWLGLGGERGAQRPAPGPTVAVWAESGCRLDPYGGCIAGATTTTGGN